MNPIPVPNQLLSQVRSALIDEWDPIGVRNFPEAHDEYDSYVKPICDKLVGGASERELLDYLWWVETIHMALEGDRQNTERFVRRLIELRPSAADSRE